MPGQYFAYVPFDDPGDLDRGIQGWIQQTHGMARERDIFRNLAKKLTEAERSGERGAISEARENVNNFENNPQTQRDKHGEVGLDRRKVPIRLNHYDGGQPLAVLGAHAPFTYTLYIVGHCTNGCRTIFNTSPRHRDTEELTAKDLVERMVNDGLPKDTFNIKLLACYGGARDDLHDEESFLKRLAAELSVHCPRMYLRGYKEPVMLSQFYQRGHPTKKAAVLEDGSIDKVKLKDGSLSDTRYNLAVGRDDWPKCVRCGKPARFKCGSCDEAFYCTKADLQADLDRHLPNCKGAH